VPNSLKQTILTVTELTYTLSMCCVADFPDVFVCSFILKQRSASITIRPLLTVALKELRSNCPFKLGAFFSARYNRYLASVALVVTRSLGKCKVNDENSRMVAVVEHPFLARDSSDQIGLASQVQVVVWLFPVCNQQRPCSSVATAIESA
jgi:hypothetical protein